MKKIKNFLYYNWIKIVAVVFVLAFGIVTFKQCSDRVEIDLGIMYAGEARSDTLHQLAENIKSAAILDDADSDGKITLNTKSILIPASREHMIEQQVPQQIQVEIISGDNLLYILDKDTLISYAVDENFADITELASKYAYLPERCLSYDDGRIYAIPLDGNLLMEETELKSEGMYIALRNYLEEDKDSKFNLNAAKALEYIIK